MTPPVWRYMCNAKRGGFRLPEGASLLAEGGVDKRIDAIRFAHVCGRASNKWALEPCRRELL